MKKFKKSLISSFLIISLFLNTNIPALANSWPTERHDQNNSGFIDEKIFPSFKESSMGFTGYQPVYANNTIYNNDGTKINAISITDERRKWWFNIANSSSSPTVDGNVLYFGDISGNLWALEDNNSAPIEKWKTSGIPTMNPVLVTDNYVIANGSKETGNKVMAFDKTTGSKLWDANLYENILAPSKGIGAPIRDGNNVIAATENNLYCFNITNGNKVWGPVDIKKEESTQNGIPVLAGNNVIIKTPQNVVKAFDKYNGTLKWTASFPSVPIKTGVVRGNNIYFLTDNGIITALNINDGTKIWSLDLNADGAAYSFNAPPIIAGRILYFASMDGTLFAVEAERGYLWNQQQLSGINSDDEYPLYMIAADGMLMMSSGINGYKILEQDVNAIDTIKPLIYDEEKAVGADITITAKIEDNLEGGVSPESITLTVDGKDVPKQSITYDQSTKVMSAYLEGFGTGNHQATLKVKDMSNNQNGLTWNFYQDSDVPQISFSSLDSTDFFIDQSSVINFNFQLSENAVITAKILDSNNNVVKTLLVNEDKNAGSVNIIWDGKDDTGNIVNNGEYRLEVTTKDNSDNTTVAVTPDINVHQKIDNFLSNLSLSNSKLVIGRDSQVDISYNLADNAQIKVVIATSNGNIVRTLFNGSKALPNDSSAILHSWDMKDDFGNPVPGGSYIVRVMGTDILGNGLELQTNLVINTINTSLVTDLHINPDPFIVGGTNKATINYNLAINSIVNVSITDLEGKVVANLLNQANQNIGLVTLPLWNGNDLDGNKLLSGEYILNVDATANNGDICVLTKNFSLNQVGDKYEYNDSFQRAVVISTGETIATINPQGDEDYYKIYVPENKPLNVILQPHNEMDGEVAIFDEKHILVNSSNTQGIGGSEKTAVFSKGQNYYIKVKDAKDGFSEAQYTLDTSFATGDYWEVNEAKKLPMAMKGTKTITDRSLDFYGDVDEFSFIAQSEGKILVNFQAPQSLNGIIWVTNKKTGKKFLVNNNMGQTENYTISVAPDDSLVFGVGDFAGEKSDEKYKFTFTFIEGPLKISNVKSTSPYSISSGKKHNINFNLSKAASVYINIYDSKKKRAFTKTIVLKKGGPVAYSWSYTGSKKVLAQKPIGKYTFVITAKDNKKKTVVYKGSFTVRK